MNTGGTLPPNLAGWFKGQREGSIEATQGSMVFRCSHRNGLFMGLREM